MTLQGQNGTRLTIETIYPQKQSSVEPTASTSGPTTKFAEEDKIAKLARSNSVTVTFKGGNRYTFEMSEQQIAALREIVRKYQITR